MDSDDREAYTEVKKEKPLGLDPNEVIASEPEVKIPDELQCVLCQGLLRDAVFLSCCAASCCDDCIRTTLIESDDHQCPVCHVIGVSPDTLIPCIKLRKEVVKFMNLSNPLWSKDPPHQVAEPEASSPKSSPSTLPPNPPPKSPGDKTSPPQPVSSSQSDDPPAKQ